MSWRITKAEWEAAGGLRSPNVYRTMSDKGRYSYWRIF